MSRLNVAAQLIRDEEYKTALDMLKRDNSSQESLYWQSLICRLFDHYDEEKKIIDMGMQKHPNFVYMQERVVWHKKPLFDRLVPRQSLRMPRDPLLTPSQSALDQLCFVVGGDSHYFHMIVECIESIRGTSLYKDVAVCVLDCGLTDDQKHYLVEALKVAEILAVDWQYKVDGFKTCDGPAPEGKLTPLNPGLKAIMSRPFLHDLFPNYRFVFWMDADSWIHDERSIDRHLDLCLRQGVAFAFPDRMPFCQRLVYQYPVIEQRYKEKLANWFHVSGNQWVIDAQTNFFEDWKKYLDYHAQKYGFWRAIDEESAMIVMEERGMTEMLTERDLYMLYAFGLPVVKDQSQTLYHPWNGQVVGIFSMFHHKFQYYWPTVLSPSGALSEEQLRQHVQNYAQLLKMVQQGQDPCGLYPGQPQISQHFRVWPWADKVEIRRLLKEVSQCQS